MIKGENPQNTKTGFAGTDAKNIPIMQNAEYIAINTVPIATLLALIKRFLCL